MTGSTVPSMSSCPIKMISAVIFRTVTERCSIPPLTSSSMTSPLPILKETPEVTGRQRYSRDSRPDVTTPKEMVETMEVKYGKANRVWVMVGTPKSLLKRYNPAWR